MIERILRFKSLSGLMMLLIYFMQQSTLNTLLGWREINVCLSKNGKSVFHIKLEDLPGCAGQWEAWEVILNAKLALYLWITMLLLIKSL